MKRSVVGLGLVMALIGCCTIFPSGCVNSIVERLTIRFLTRTNYAILKDPGIHVIMVGTGSPEYDKIRNPQCIAVIAEGRFMVFDTGNGCTRTMESLNLPLTRISIVFLTHYHSDHMNGLGNLISYTWENGRKNPIDVYGPPGVENVVNGFAASAHEDIATRSGPDSLHPINPALAVGIATVHVHPYIDSGHRHIAQGCQSDFLQAAESGSLMRY